MINTHSPNAGMAAHPLIQGRTSSLDPLRQRKGRHRPPALKHSQAQPSHRSRAYASHSDQASIRPR